jgi:NAD(P)-dependent dehydrogenase (short-subunit alcohol dehydrogenase family)
MNYTSDKSTELTQKLASELESEYSIKAIIVQADMGSENGPELVVSTAKNHFKHPKKDTFQIDIIVNNAGVGGNAPLGKIAVDDFARQYNVNVRGPLLLVQAALPYLPKDRSGRIVNMSSISASMGLPGQSIYGGTKAALEEMTRTWARELSERCTVNSLNPGPIATDMYAGTSPEFRDMLSHWIKNTPLMAAREDFDTEEQLNNAKSGGGRLAYAHEIAGLVGMLCSQESGWCTGSVISANGGMKFST